MDRKECVVVKFEQLRSAVKVKSINVPLSLGKVNCTRKHTTILYNL